MVFYYGLFSNEISKFNQKFTLLVFKLQSATKKYVF